MDIRELSPTFSVSPQIAPEDMDMIRAQGFTTVICNRPDAENPPELHMSAMKAAAEEAGLSFVANPITHGNLGMDQVALQGDTEKAAEGPVLAYCASGNRSSIVWALAHAGDMPTDDIIGAATRAGYSLEGMRGQIDALAGQR